MTIEKLQEIMKETNFSESKFDVFRKCPTHKEFNVVHYKVDELKGITATELIEVIAYGFQAKGMVLEIRRADVGSEG